MSQGYVDPVTKKYVQSAGNLNISNVPEATKTTSGLMSAQQVQKLDSAYSSADIADEQTIKDLFKKEA